MCRRRVIVLVLVGVLTMTSTANGFVIAVFDIANLIRNATISLQTGLHAELLDQQFRTIRRMARRLTEYIGDVRARYGIRHDDPPRWRTHDFGETFPFGAGYLAALNYGDATGYAYDGIARPVQSVTDVPASSPPEAREALASAYATIEIADALMRTGTHQAGQIRFNSRRFYQATNAFELDAFDGDLEQSTTAVLDKLNAALVLELKQKQARNQLLITAVELAALDNKRWRDAETIGMNHRIRQWQHYREYSRSFYRDAAIHQMRDWRQP